MAQLVARRSFFDRIEVLSVVSLAIAFAVLTIALGVEWGRIVQGMVTDVARYDEPAASLEPDTLGVFP